MRSITTALLLAIFTTSLSAQFAPGVSLSTNMIEVREVRVVDVDGDLDMDVVVRQPNAIGWFASDGEGNFASFDTLHVSIGELGAFDIADVQGDGLPDLVVADAGADAILLLLNEGLGGFEPPESVVGMNGGIVGRLHLADVFAGGGPELLYMSGDILVLPNEGGTFGEAEVITGVGGGNPDFQVLEIDGDGDLDVVKFTGLTPALGLLLNPGVEGEPWEQIQQGFGNSVGGRPFQTLDVDGDGDLDLANAGNHTIQWWRFPLLGTGPFVLGGGGVAGSTSSQYRRGWTARLGCGPGASMVWTDSIGQPVQWATYDAVLEGFGPVGFLPDLPSFLEIGAGDIDGDGKEDVVLWHDDSILSWYRSMIEGPSTSIVAEPFDTLCSSGAAYALADAVPIGGAWSGPGVSENIFTPTGDGAFELVYTISDATSGCPLSVRQTLTVLLAPTVTLVSGDATSNCDTSPLFYTATPAGGTWSNAADEYGVVDRSCAARPLNDGAVYTMNAVNGGNCLSSGAFFQLPSCTLLDLGPDQQLCLDQDTLEVLLQGPNAGIAELSGFDEVESSSPFSATGFFHPVNGPGIYEFTGTAIAPSSCQAFDTVMVEVLPIPEVIVTFEVLCSNGGEFQLSSEGSPAGGSYYLNDGTDPVAVLDPALLNDSSYVLRYVYTDSVTGCTGVDTTTFTVETCVGVSAQSMGSDELRIMPNPARAGFIRISYPRSAHLRIYDNTGRVVKELPYFPGTDVLDLSALAPGVYVLNLIAEGQARTERVVIE